MNNYKILGIALATEAIIDRRSSKWIKKHTTLLKRDSNAAVFQ